jgi:hypothetical protein
MQRPVVLERHQTISDVECECKLEIEIDVEVGVYMTRVRLHKSATPEIFGSTNTTYPLPLIGSLLFGKIKKVEE